MTLTMSEIEMITGDPSDRSVSTNGTGVSHAPSKGAADLLKDGTTTSDGELYGDDDRIAAHNKTHWGKDSKRVFLWMSLVLIMIVLTAGIVIALILSFLEHDQEEQFQNGFDQSAHVIEEAVVYHTKIIVASLESIALSITSYAKTTNSEWPFITLPDFEMRAEFVISEADMELVAFSPIVSAEERDRWVSYCTNESDWMANQGGFHADGIYHVDPATGQKTPSPPDVSALPLWMTSPRPYNASLVNYDLLSDPVYAGLLQSVLDDPHSKFSDVFSNEYMNDMAYPPGYHDILNAPLSIHESHDHDHDAEDGSGHLLRRKRQLKKQTEGPEVDKELLGRTPNMRRRQLVDDSTASTPEPMDDDTVGTGHNMEDDVEVEESHNSEHDHPHEEKETHASLEDHDEDVSLVVATSSGFPHAENSPHSVMMTPVWDSFDAPDRKVTGVVFGILPWDFYLTDLLPVGVDGIIVILRNTCHQHYKFLVNGPMVEVYNEHDIHNAKYESMALHIELEEAFGTSSSSSEDYASDKDADDYCHYTLSIYPSKAFENSYKSEDSTKFVALIGSVFAILALFFFIFLWFVQRRQKRVVKLATRTTTIVSSLFPEAVRDRILQQAAQEAKDNSDSASTQSSFSRGKASRALRGILNEGKEGKGGRKRGTNAKAGRGRDISVLVDAPIADLYPDCTVGFFDLVGFTAWSSTREPSQVFVLLETLYGEFDSIAKRRRVFKVETIGDCYVAVCGLPQPRRDHAIVMSRFARECLAKSSEVFHYLELTLGPGTSALDLRLGLHSGPVTAGVLRGEKSRFQLFGDTVNTAARMESNSEAGKIHCSKETADLIMMVGKGSWLLERPDRIVAKGKGSLVTFWIDVGSNDASSVKSNFSDLSSCGGLDSPDLLDDIAALALNNCNDDISEGYLRLVNWNVELLSKLLKNIIASRTSSRRKKTKDIPAYEVKPDQMPFDEWSQAIDLPEKSKENADGSEIQLSEKIVSELRLFVFNIACLHGRNPFHNFDHASHVTLSTHKLLTRVIQSGDDSYRVASDPLVHFAATMSALIHDVDHMGVPNDRLMKEWPDLAKKYAGKSVAEQHAIDLSWQLLMKDDFVELRKTIYTTESERQRFRTILVNSVLSTDIVNKDLKALRNERWAMAFSDQVQEGADRYRASCVLEHLIQASDVSHTMQHWKVYRGWNEKLFKEQYAAYKEGRSETDPSIAWYQGELGFFDFYIIPLAKKLAEVGVFGVSSSEYLDFALKNRDEWAIKGQGIVATMLEQQIKLEELAQAAVAVPELLQETAPPPIKRSRMEEIEDLLDLDDDPESALPLPMVVTADTDEYVEDVFAGVSAMLSEADEEFEKLMNSSTISC